MPVINFDYSELKTFCGYYKNEELLKDCASGGAASILAESIIKTGGVVYGVIYSHDYKSAEYGRFTSLKKLKPFKGSKYIPAKKKVLVGSVYKSVYELVAQDLNAGKKVLFTGLGCDVGAVLMYMKSKGIDDSFLYTVDLICHGTTLKQVGEFYIENLEKKFNSTIIDFSVRYKKFGTNPHYLRATFQNGKIFEKEFYQTEYGIAFSKYARKSCYSCKYKGANHLADITIGDFWGQDKTGEEYNRNGVSVLFVRTSKGVNMINSIDRNRYSLYDADTKIALEGNPMFWKNRLKLSSSDRFEKEIKVVGLSKALKECETFKEKLKHTWIYKIYKRCHVP